MISWLRIVCASALYYRRTHLGVVLATALATAVLSGALIVGDAVRATLRTRAMERIGGIDLALSSGDRFFRTELARELGTALKKPSAAALALQGVANTPDGKQSVGGVAVLGVDAAFFALAPKPFAEAPGVGEAWINQALAERLQLAPGASFALRVAKPSPMPRDLVLAQAEEVSTGLRLRLARVIEADAFASFDLRAQPNTTPLIYVSREWIASELELKDQANLLVLGAPDIPVSLEQAQLALRTHWQLEDAELRTRAAHGDWRELISPRVFLDEPIAHAAQELEVPLLGVLTYFVNELRYEDRATPYSMVSALGRLDRGAAEVPLLDAELARIVPQASDSISIQSWLAEDLQVAAGQTLSLRYWAIGADRRLREDTQSFRVDRVLETKDLSADPSLMPEFPGLHDSEHCRDWEPGAPVDLDKIRDQDEEWWEERKGTPKAFLSLQEGQALWASRFGNLTAIRWNPITHPDFEARLRDLIDPAALGLSFSAARDAATAASNATTDLGGLFLGLSFFLIAAALLLVGMLFGFSVEQRASEIGTYRSLGFPRGAILRLFLAEGAFLALLGVGLGSLGALLYGDLVLGALRGAWSGAVGDTPLRMDWNLTTLLFGATSSLLVALLPIALVLRRMLRRDTLDLLRATLPEAALASRVRSLRRMRLWCGVQFLVAVALFAYGLLWMSGAALAAMLFGAGFLFMVALLSMLRIALHRASEVPSGSAARSIAALAWQNAARRPPRSLGVAALLASGTFLVLSIEAYRQAPPRDPSIHASGTGGFRLIAESTLPVFADLARSEGRQLAQLDEALFDQAELLPVRVRDGDEASCLSLAVPREPRLLGIDSAQLAERDSFEAASALDLPDDASIWSLLTRDYGSDVVPAIGDSASVTWSLHKSLGDGVRYVDERGHEFEVRIVGTLKDSMLQGVLLIDAAAFRERFPSISGARQFWIDAPEDRAQALSQALERNFADLGLQVTPSVTRLAAFQRVQNTYLEVFQLLGFLGLLLGSVGLGLVVLRNVLERRSELALLRALGWRKGEVRRLLLREHALLVLAGMLIGGVAALAPALASIGQGASFLVVLVLFALGTVNALLWVWLAAGLAARTPVISALRAMSS